MLLSIHRYGKGNLHTVQVDINTSKGPLAVENESPVVKIITLVCRWSCFESFLCSGVYGLIDLIFNFWQIFHVPACQPFSEVASPIDYQYQSEKGEVDYHPVISYHR